VRNVSSCITCACSADTGGYEFKKAIVDAIVDLMGAIAETKESSLLHLCEFIEDCEFSELIVQTLYIIG
jgi:coatomer protein complex subunit gamma